MALRDEHPDDDQLADLAADVLPLAQARAVEAHVLACDRCSELLADAERIRGMLVAGDPGPMPADVWARIEAALTGAGAPIQPATPIHSSAPVPPLAPSPQPATAGWGDEDADPLDRPDRWAAARVPVTATSSLRRISVSRRDSRSDARRPGRFLVAAGAAAAAVVGAVAVGVGILHLGTGGSAGTAAIGDAGGATSAAAAAEGAAGGAAAATGGGGLRYERSGIDYTSAALDRQVRALVTQASAAPAGPPRSTATARTAAQAPAASDASGAGAGGARSMQLAAPDPTATDVSNPAALAGCLTALKTSMDRLVTVDLATYEHREAAVLVLRATGGGYEVFVVERTCSASEDHSLAYRALKG